MNYQIYHNPKCSKSRKALELLESKGIKPEIILYLDNPPSVSNFVSLVQTILKLENPLDVIRVKEDLFKELKLENKKMTVKEWGEIIQKHPKLLERPIVIKDGATGVIARPPEKVLEII